MEPTRFDLTAQRVARLDPLGFFCWLLKAFAEHLRFAGWLDPRSTPEEADPEVTGDTVARLVALYVVGPPWMFPVEFQTVPDPGMFGRLNKQIGEWWNDLRPDDLPDSRFQVSAAVVNLTGTRKSAPASRRYRLPTPDGLWWGGKVCERYIAEESADKTLARVEKGELRPILLALIPVMKGAGKKGIITRWLAAATTLELDVRRRADLGSLALTLAALKDWFPDWKEALKEWKMQESPFVLELTAEAKREGKIEGKLEGQLEAKRDALRVLLEVRFGPLSDELLRRIEEIAEVDKIDLLFRAAVGVKRPEKLPF